MFSPQMRLVCEWAADQSCSKEGMNMTHHVCEVQMSGQTLTAKSPNTQYSGTNTFQPAMTQM